MTTKRLLRTVLAGYLPLGRPATRLAAYLTAHGIPAFGYHLKTGSQGEQSTSYSPWIDPRLRKFFQAHAGTPLYAQIDLLPTQRVDAIRNSHSRRARSLPFQASIYVYNHDDAQLRSRLVKLQSALTVLTRAQGRLL